MDNYNLTYEKNEEEEKENNYYYNLINDNNYNINEYNTLENNENNIINNFIQYKEILNLELLKFLEDEKEKKELRERQLEELNLNDPQRETLKKELEKEKEEMKNILIQKINEINEKLYYYNLELTKKI